MEEKEVEKKENTFFESIGILPKLSIVIIILSLVFHIVYYQHFGLPIKYFINFSELGIAISDDLIVIILTYVGMILFTILNVKWSHALDKKRSASKVDEVKKVPSGSPLAFRIWIVFLLTLQLSFSFLIKVNFVFDLVLSLVFGATIFNFLLAKDDYDPNGLLSSRNFTFITVFVLVSSFRLSNDIYSVEKGEFKGTIITTSDTSYISNDSTYFIGKTEKYVFIYKVKDSGTLVIPTESVKQMFIKSK